MKYLLLIFACSAAVFVKAQVNNTVSKPQPNSALKISTIPSWQGDLGCVTFLQNKKTIFYFDRKKKSGKIILNNKNYIINSEKTNELGYLLFGNGLNIKAYNCKYNEEEEGDCSYGKFATISVKLNNTTLILKNVDIQDCYFDGEVK